MPPHARRVLGNPSGKVTSVMSVRPDSHSRIFGRLPWSPSMKRSRSIECSVVESEGCSVLEDW